MPCVQCTQLLVILVLVRISCHMLQQCEGAAVAICLCFCAVSTNMFLALMCFKRRQKACFCFQWGIRVMSVTFVMPLHQLP